MDVSSDDDEREEDDEDDALYLARPGRSYSQIHMRPRKLNVAAVNRWREEQLADVNAIRSPAFAGETETELEEEVCNSSITSLSAFNSNGKRTANSSSTDTTEPISYTPPYRIPRPLFIRSHSLAVCRTRSFWNIVQYAQHYSSSTICKRYHHRLCYICSLGALFYLSLLSKTD